MHKPVSWPIFSGPGEASALRVNRLGSQLDMVTRQRAIDALDRAQVSYAEAMDALFAAKFTGPVTLHFAEGVPKALDVANPLTVKLV